MFDPEHAIGRLISRDTQDFFIRECLMISVMELNVTFLAREHYARKDILRLRKAIIVGSLPFSYKEWLPSMEDILLMIIFKSILVIISRKVHYHAIERTIC